MTNVNELYYIVVRDKSFNPYYLKADENTPCRDYYFPTKISANEPLRFTSSTYEKDKENNTPRNLSNILMDGLGMVIDSTTKDLLMNQKVKGMDYFPAVFIDNQGCRHEDYWYLNFFDNFDCWDRNKSILEEDEDDEVLEYFLDGKVLNEAAINERKMFRMAGSTMDHIFIHQEIVDILVSIKVSGVKFLKVSSFTEGDQY